MNNINRRTTLPIILSILLCILSYSISKSFVDISRITYVNTFLDDIIPLFTGAVIIYILAYIQWLVVTCILFKQDTKFGYRIALTFTINSLLLFLIYITFPTGIVRPNLQINNIFDWILSQIYLIDSPINVFPSFHCFGSTMTIIVLNHAIHIDTKYKIMNIIFSILVYLSTLLTKQHYFIDVPAGILMTYISYIISTKLLESGI